MGERKPAWRELVRTHAHDFHTEPADPRRAAYALGHAHGLALLHGQQGPAPCTFAVAAALHSSAGQNALLSCDRACFQIPAVIALSQP